MTQRSLLDIARNKVEIALDRGAFATSSLVLSIDERGLSGETTWSNKLYVNWSDVRSVTHGRTIIGHDFGPAEAIPTILQRLLTLDLKMARPCDIRLPNLSARDYATLLVILGNIAMLRKFDLLTHEA